MVLVRSFGGASNTTIRNGQVMSGGLGSQGHCEQSTSTLMLRHVTAVNRWLRLFYRLHVGKHQCRVHDRLIKRHLARGIFQIVAVYWIIIHLALGLLLKVVKARSLIEGLKIK